MFVDHYEELRAERALEELTTVFMASTASDQDRRTYVRRLEREAGGRPKARKATMEDLRALGLAVESG